MQATDPAWFAATLALLSCLGPAFSQASALLGRKNPAPARPQKARAEARRRAWRRLGSAGERTASRGRAGRRARQRRRWWIPRRPRRWRGERPLGSACSSARRPTLGTSRTREAENARVGVPCFACICAGGPRAHADVIDTCGMRTWCANTSLPWGASWLSYCMPRKTSSERGAGHFLVAAQARRTPTARAAGTSRTATPLRPAMASTQAHCIPQSASLRSHPLTPLYMHRSARSCTPAPARSREPHNRRTSTTLPPAPTPLATPALPRRQLHASKPHPQPRQPLRPSPLAKHPLLFLAARPAPLPRCAARRSRSPGRLRRAPRTQLLLPAPRSAQYMSGAGG